LRRNHKEPTSIVKETMYLSLINLR